MNYDLFTACACASVFVGDGDGVVATLAYSCRISDITCGPEPAYGISSVLTKDNVATLADGTVFGVAGDMAVRQLVNRHRDIIACLTALGIRYRHCVCHIAARRCCRIRNGRITQSLNRAPAICVRRGGICRCEVAAYLHRVPGTDLFV